MLSIYLQFMNQKIRYSSSKKKKVNKFFDMGYNKRGDNGGDKETSSP